MSQEITNNPKNDYDKPQQDQPEHSMEHQIDAQHHTDVENNDIEYSDYNDGYDHFNRDLNYETDNPETLNNCIPTTTDTLRR